MMRFSLLIALSLCLLLTGGAAGVPAQSEIPAAEALDTAVSKFTLQGDRLILTHSHARAVDREAGPSALQSFDQAIVSVDGVLTFNGSEVSTDKRDRKLLRKFYREVRELDRVNTDFSAEVELVVKASVGDRAEANKGGAADDNLADRVASAVGGLEKSAHRIEAQGERVMKIAAELKERIPALTDFGWNLDD